VGGDGIEFLLVQSRGGRWIFPKGSIESGLTHAQSAALEAFEEAGVHGRIEETSFAQYVRRGRAGARQSARATRDTLVHAYLCEVHRLGRPQESNRNRTWFTAEKAKRRLQEERREDFGAELARVVDRALSRIRRLRGLNDNSADCNGREPLQRVRFEAFEGARLHHDLREAMLARYFFGHGRGVRVAASIGGTEQIRGSVLRLGNGAGSGTTKT
jgi:8-oxo-dGTP pyrophosphatase MutT (NUDIX family)